MSENFYRYFQKTEFKCLMVHKKTVMRLNLKKTERKIGQKLPESEQHV